MEQSKNETSSLFSDLTDKLRQAGKWLKSSAKKLKTQVLTKFAKWSDPKLEPYRTSLEPSSVRVKNPETAKNNPKSTPKNSSTLCKTTDKEASAQKNSAPEPEQTKPEKPYTPRSITEFLDVMRRTPRSVLNQRERHVIATIMNFPHTKVSEIMLPQTSITYIRDDEVLGPLTLDRLYRSGFQHFPVLDYDRHIIGLIHTTALNSLEIKETSRASEILDPKVYYIREDYTLNQALAAFLRTNCYFFLVIDRFERIVGMLTYEMLVDYLLGETPTDNFDRDNDRLAVAKRKI